LFDRALKELRVVAEDAERKRVRPSLLEAIGGRLRHRVSAQPEDEQADAWNVVAAAAARTRNATHVHRVREQIECAADELERAGIAHVHRAAFARTQVIEMLHAREESIELDGACGPTGAVACEIFEQRQRSLAPAGV